MELNSHIIYLLLTIIAIGVLLASEAGKKLLRFIIIALIAGGLLYLGFWIVLIVVSFFIHLSTEAWGKGVYYSKVIAGLLLLFFIVLLPAYNNRKKRVRNAEKTDA